jgi:hypothetical protein
MNDATAPGIVPSIKDGELFNTRSRVTIQTKSFAVTLGFRPHPGARLAGFPRVV